MTERGTVEGLDYSVVVLLLCLFAFGIRLLQS